MEGTVEYDDSKTDEKLKFYLEFGTKLQLEADKQLLILASLALGLLVSFRAEVESLGQTITWVVAALFFLVCIALVLWLYYLTSRSATHLMRSLPVPGDSRDPRQMSDDVRKARRMDRVCRIMTVSAYVMFACGTFLLACLAFIQSSYIQNLGA